MKIHGVVSAFIFWMASSVFAAPYDTVMTEMSNLVSQNPELVQMVQLNKSDSGKPLMGLRINKGTGPDKVAHLVVGAHHGNEGNSVTVAMRFAKDLVANLTTPSESGFAKLEAYTYYVFPVLNIDGYNRNRREEINAQGKSIDPNRDYPDPCGNPAEFRLSSTKSLADFMIAKKVVGAVTIHGYIGTFTYPWGIYTDSPKTYDDSEFSYVVRESARENGYQYGTHAEVIYPTVGAFEDWAYFKHGIWVSLLELSRKADFGQDAKALLKYFTLVSATRSVKHEHTGKCTNLARIRVLSRP